MFHYRYCSMFMVEGVEVGGVLEHNTFGRK